MFVFSKELNAKNMNDGATFSNKYVIHRGSYTIKDSFRILSRVKPSYKLDPIKYSD
jgi:hypothetical protein